MKNKNKGISLLITLGLSFLLFGVVMLIIEQVARSLEQSTNIARSNQIFFATESGIEAALFHHNARGAGLVFPQPGDTSDTTKPQNIYHEKISTTTTWDINGRAEKTYGLLKENQTIQIPLEWDKSDEPEDSATTDSTSHFELVFYDKITAPPSASAPGSETDTELLIKEYGEIDTTTIWPTSSQDILIDWKVTRKGAQGIETFIPDHYPTTAPTITQFITPANLTGTKTIETSSSSSIPGTILPCRNPAAGTTTCNENLNTFMTTTSGTFSNYQLIFHPLKKFSNGTTKIHGIPFTLTGQANTPIPQNKYKITAKVTQSDFNQTQILTIPERTTLSSFNYVIFD